MEFILIFLLSYISGSIPFGLILTKLFQGKDIRKFGSGNIGATNVLRTGNKTLAIITLILDVLKGYFPVMITSNYSPEFIQLSALIAFLGHLFPVWLSFKGGKGVATYLGVLIALSLQLSVLFVFTWIIVSLIFKYSSLSSMFSSFTVVVISVVRNGVNKAINPNLDITNDINVLLFIFFILIIFTHRENISNLKKKKEKKIKI